MALETKRRMTTATPTPVRSSVAPRFSGLVMIVDDEPMLRRMLRRTLERYGLDVVEASDGQQAIDLMQRLHSELSAVLLDWNMPILSGEETMAGLKQYGPTVPILVLSGAPVLSRGLASASSRMSGFLKKPFRADGLEVVLRELLSK